MDIKEKDKQFKNWLQSKTIWGIIIVLLPVISQFLGFDVSTEVGETYESLIQIAGTALSLYGRWKANTAIVIGKIPKE